MRSWWRKQFHVNQFDHVEHDGVVCNQNLHDLVLSNAIYHEYLARDAQELTQRWAAVNFLRNLFYYMYYVVCLCSNSTLHKCIESRDIDKQAPYITINTCLLDDFFVLGIEAVWWAYEVIA